MMPEVKLLVSNYTTIRQESWDQNSGTAIPKSTCLLAKNGRMICLV